MTDQPPTPITNGDASKGVLWQKTEEGRAKLSAAQKRAHKERPGRNTMPISGLVITRLQAMIKQGKSTKEAATSLGIGHSTAQRYLTKIAKAGGAAVRTAKRARLTPQQKAILEEMVPKMPDAVSAPEIAKAAKCHVSSVYTYRSRWMNSGKATLPAVVVNGGVPTVVAEDGIGMRLYQELKYANKILWNSVWDERREPTDSEMMMVMAWRRATNSNRD